MYILTIVASGCLFAATACAQRQDGQFWPCNPIKNTTGACNPNPGLPTSAYSVDFTQVTAVPADWTISNYATVNFGPLGAEFTYAKRYDAPRLWTDFFILFGRVSIEARVANGTGMISSAVLMSDDFDEIDFEFSGNNFGDTASKGKGQNNYFGKGITGNYDRGGLFNVNNPQGTFHTYVVDWTPERLLWEVDGVVVRTFAARNSTKTKGSAYQYPQTPTKFQLGIWAGGDPGQNSGTKAWAGGTTNISAAPYTVYVKKVKIENYMPAWAYNWTDQSGTWQSIDLLKDPLEDIDAGNETTLPPSMEGNSTDPSDDGLNGVDDEDDDSSKTSMATLPVTSSGTTRSSALSTRSFSTSSSSVTASVSKSASVSSTTKSSASTSLSSQANSKSASSSSKPTGPSSTSKPATTSTAKTTSTSEKALISTTRTTSAPKMTTAKPRTTSTTCVASATKPKTTSPTTQWHWGSWGSWWRGGNNFDDGNWNWAWQQRQRGFL